ncbi:reverse transcriptase domain-containing protein [Tanacetum coccineum]
MPRRDRAAVRAEIERTELHFRETDEVRRHEWAASGLINDLLYSDISCVPQALAAEHALHMEDTGSSFPRLWFDSIRNSLTTINDHYPRSSSCHAMGTLKKMMTDKYCPMGEIKNIKTEMWNLKVKGTDVVAYNRRFQQLALMCARMFPEEVDKIEMYIGGLPDMILGSVKASKPKTMLEVIEFIAELMEDKTHANAERQAEHRPGLYCRQ